MKRSSSADVGVTGLEGMLLRGSGVVGRLVTGVVGLEVAGVLLAEVPGDA